MALYVLLRTLAYASLLGAGLWANRAEPRMLMLVSVVGASIFLPLPMPSTATLWYLQCLIVEVAVAFSAYSLRAPVSLLIVFLSALLGILHGVGMVVGPQPGISAYRVGVPIIEFAELVACLLLSNPVRRCLSRVATKEPE